MPKFPLSEHNVVLGALRATAQWHELPEGSRVVAPFITISRQAGAGGRALAASLVTALNQADPGAIPWTAWDDELVQQVAAEFKIPEARIASIEEGRTSWFEECLDALAFVDDYPDDLKVYHSVASSIRRLAQLGRVVIVGRGGVFITRELPAGLHIRLVAPLPHRIRETMLSRQLSRDGAEKWVRDQDHRREAFYRRYWPSKLLIPENFSVTFNTAVLPCERVAASVVPLIVPVKCPQGAAT